MKITEEFIRKGASHPATAKFAACGWNAKQLKILELKYPLPRGWIKTIIGKEISDENMQLFIELKGKSKKAEKEERKNKLNIEQKTLNI